MHAGFRWWIPHGASFAFPVLEAMVQKHPEHTELLEPDSMGDLIPEIEDEDAEPAAASWVLARMGTSNRGRTGTGVNIYVLYSGINARSGHKL